MAAVSSGKQIEAHRHELDPIIRAIAREHTMACRNSGDPCWWSVSEDEVVEAVLCDMDKTLERLHVRASERKAA